MLRILYPQIFKSYGSHPKAELLGKIVLWFVLFCGVAAISRWFFRIPLIGWMIGWPMQTIGGLYCLGGIVISVLIYFQIIKL